VTPLPAILWSPHPLSGAGNWILSLRQSLWLSNRQTIRKLRRDVRVRDWF